MDSLRLENVFPAHDARRPGCGNTLLSGKPFGRLLLTGAGVNLGRQLRSTLPGWADVVRISDITPLGEAAAQEEVPISKLHDSHLARPGQLVPEFGMSDIHHSLDALLQVQST